MAMPTFTLRLRLVVVGVLLALLAVGVAAWLFVPRTLTDVGPLDLPGLPPSPGPGEEVLLAVGDIAHCDRDADEVVGELASELPGTIAMLGDNVYPTGTRENYRECLEPTWGELRDRMRATPGNHDYVAGGAEAYFEWFGPAAGTPGEGWYAYELGDWRVIVLNSMCVEEEVGGGECGPGTQQYEWLAQELRTVRPADCLLAYWHHPRHSSGRHGSVLAVEPLWRALVQADVDVTLHGHDHHYERLEVDGVQSFVVGTGGRSLYQFQRDELPETAARHEGSYGLLYLLLGEDRFRWEFLPVGITVFTDSGEAEC